MLGFDNRCVNFFRRSRLQAHLQRVAKSRSVRDQASVAAIVFMLDMDQCDPAARNEARCFDGIERCAQPANGGDYGSANLPASRLGGYAARRAVVRHRLSRLVAVATQPFFLRVAIPMRGQQGVETLTLLLNRPFAMVRGFIKARVVQQRELLGEKCGERAHGCFAVK